MTGHPQIPHWHMPNDCAYSKTTGLQQTKMLFLLEPYSAAVGSISALTDKHMLTKAKQNKADRNPRRTLPIILNLQAFQYHHSSEVKHSTRKLCDSASPGCWCMLCSVRPGPWKGILYLPFNMLWIWGTKVLAFHSRIYWIPSFCPVPCKATCWALCSVQRRTRRHRVPAWWYSQCKRGIRHM